MASAELTIVEQPPQRATLAPRNLDEALRFSEYLSKSDFIPNDFRGKPANILVAVQFGMEIGLGPMQALQSIAVINGRPTLWGDAALAVCMNHPAYEWHREGMEDSGENRCGVFSVKRKGAEAHTVRFSVQDAKAAGLWGKAGPWKQYPDRMLQLRARGFGLRDKFADALKGLITREEAQDLPLPAAMDNTGHTVIDPTPAPPKPPLSAPPVLISREQAKAFADAWKESKKSAAEVRPWLKEALGIERSLDIPADQYEMAMLKARQEPGQIASPDALNHRKACELMGILNYEPDRVAKMLFEFENRMPELVAALEQELERP